MVAYSVVMLVFGGVDMLKYRWMVGKSQTKIFPNELNYYLMHPMVERRTKKNKPTHLSIQIPSLKLGFAWPMPGKSEPSIFSQMMVKDGDLLW